MKSTRVTIDLTTEEIEVLSKRCHFDQEDITLIQAVYEAMRPIIQGEIIAKIIEDNTLLREAMTETYLEEVKGSDIYAAAIVTLGAGVDKLQESYLEKENLKEAYIMECLGGELLSKAYEKLEDILSCETRLHAKSFEFLGDCYPIQMIPDVFDYLDQTTVSYNKAYELSPLKSVVLFIRLKEGEKDTLKCSPLNICSNCNYLACDNRRKEVTTENLNYGYQRIFGTQQK